MVLALQHGFIFPIAERASGIYYYQIQSQQKRSCEVVQNMESDRGGFCNPDVLENIFKQSEEKEEMPKSIGNSLQRMPDKTRNNSNKLSKTATTANRHNGRYWG